MIDSTIGWTEHTQNFWIGCEKVSAGCRFCYAEDMMANRFKKVEWGRNGMRVRTSPKTWAIPYRLNDQLEKGLVWRV